MNAEQIKILENIRKNRVRPAYAMRLFEKAGPNVPKIIRATRPYNNGHLDGDGLFDCDECLEYGWQDEIYHHNTTVKALQDKLEVMTDRVDELESALINILDGPMSKNSIYEIVSTALFQIKDEIPKVSKASALAETERLGQEYDNDKNETT